MSKEGSMVVNIGETSVDVRVGDRVHEPAALKPGMVVEYLADGLNGTRFKVQAPANDGWIECRDQYGFPTGLITGCVRSFGVEVLEVPPEPLRVGMRFRWADADYLPRELHCFSRGDVGRVIMGEHSMFTVVNERTGKAWRWPIDNQERSNMLEAGVRWVRVEDADPAEDESACLPLLCCSGLLAEPNHAAHGTPGDGVYICVDPRTGITYTTEDYREPVNGELVDA